MHRPIILSSQHIAIRANIHVPKYNSAYYSVYASLKNFSIINCSKSFTKDHWENDQVNCINILLTSLQKRLDQHIKRLQAYVTNTPTT